MRYLKILGNEKEAENCRNADEELLNAIEKHTEGKSFSEWKTKVSQSFKKKKQLLLPILCHIIDLAFMLKFN